MAGPAAMLASRKQRHEWAWGSYCAQRDALAAGLQQQAAQLAAGLKRWLDGDDGAVESQLTRLGDNVVMELSELDIQQVGGARRLPAPSNLGTCVGPS
jgi:hypothetical protein